VDPLRLDVELPTSAAGPVGFSVKRERSGAPVADCSLVADIVRSEGPAVHFDMSIATASAEESAALDLAARVSKALTKEGLAFVWLRATCASSEAESLGSLPQRLVVRRLAGDLAWFAPEESSAAFAALGLASDEEHDAIAWVETDTMKEVDDEGK
jgi:hypothetical protein